MESPNKTTVAADIQDILNLESDDKFEFRLLSKNDFNKGFLDVLAQLTKIGTIDQSSFENRFNEIFTPDQDTYYIIVIIDKSNDS